MNALESAFYASIGLALKGKEKAEELAKKFVEENKMNADEGKKFVESVVKSAEETKDELAKKIEEMTKTAMDKVGLATKKEVDALKASIAALEAKLNK